MPNCHEMKKGNLYVCEECGLELEVAKECEEYGISTKCGCEPCTFICCGRELRLKE